MTHKISITTLSLVILGVISFMVNASDPNLKLDFEHESQNFSPNNSQLIEYELVIKQKNAEPIPTNQTFLSYDEAELIIQKMQFLDHHYPLLFQENQALYLQNQQLTRELIALKNQLNSIKPKVIVTNPKPKIIILKNNKTKNKNTQHENDFKEQLKKNGTNNKKFIKKNTKYNKIKKK